MEGLPAPVPTLGLAGYAPHSRRGKQGVTCIQRCCLWADIPRTLLVGALGGGIAGKLGMPLPWMIGSAASTAAAGVAGLTPNTPRWLRLAMQMAVGVLLGAQFGPEFPAIVRRSAGSVLGLIVLTVVGTCVGTVYLVRVARYRGVTALLAAAPGGLNDMLLLGIDLGADQKVIGLTHICRVLSITAALPFLLRSLDQSDGIAGAIASSTAAVQVPGPAPGAADWAILLACVIAGPIVARRLPARFLLGPLTLSALAHVSGLTAASPPKWVARLAQCVLGAGLGARLVASGGAPREVVRIALAGLSATLLLLALALASASAVHLLLRRAVPWPLLVLSYSPGGMTEMCLTALSMGYDVAFVATHHALRLAVLLLVLPLAARSRWVKRLGRGVSGVSS